MNQNLKEFKPYLYIAKEGANTQLTYINLILQFYEVKSHSSKMQVFYALFNACFRRNYGLKETRSTINTSGIKKNGTKG